MHVMTSDCESDINSSICSAGEISYQPPDISFMGRMLKMKFHVQELISTLLAKLSTMMGALENMEFTFLQMVKSFT